jgi:hypothetical protein
MVTTNQYIYPQHFLLQWIWQQISGGQAWYFYAMCYLSPVFVAINIWLCPGREYIIYS